MRASQRSIVLPTMAMVLYSVLAASVFVVLPLLVGAMVDFAGLTAQEAGMVAAADMLGATASSLLVSICISRGRWRAILLVGISLFALGNFISGIAHHFVALFPCRVIAGLGEGTLLTIANASISETRAPDRVFGFSLAGQVAFGSPALFVMPSILVAYGLRGVFWALGIMTTASICLVKYMPDRARSNGRSDTGQLVGEFSDQSILGLGGVFTFFVAQGGVWAYLDRIGESNRIPASDVATALALSSIAGFVGAMLASWLDVRQGRFRPILASTILASISLILLNETTTFALFAVMASLLNFSWNVLVPYQLGTLSLIDVSRRTVALSGVVIFAGLALGPAIAASLIYNANFRNVNWMGMTFCVASLLLLGRILIPLEHRRDITTVQQARDPSA